MEFTRKLTQKEIADAVSEYLDKRGYQLKKFKFNTSCEYRRVLFDRQLNSWFEDMTVVVEEKK